MAILAKESVAPNVIIGPRPAFMGLTVDLNRQTQRAAVKVGNIGTYAMPLTKLDAQLLAAELLPKQHLGQRHFRAKAPGKQRRWL